MSGFTQRETRHAKRRMQQRAISKKYIQMALDWGREKYQTGGTYQYRIGYREAHRAKAQGLDVMQCLGLVVITTANTTIITTYWSRKKRV